MLNKKKQTKLQGFSLFELLVTMGILLILSTIVFPLATQRAQMSKLETYASQLVTDTYFQQQEAYLKGIPKGLKISSDGYTLFDGESLATATETDIKTYPTNIGIGSISLSSGNEIVFQEGVFKPSSYGTLIISDGTFSVRVYINQEGLIEYETL